MRRRLDQYFTPAHAMHELQRRVCIEGSVLECCNGDSGISRELRRVYAFENGARSGPCAVWTNDIDESLDADFHFDATQPWIYPQQYDWAVSNPPFNCAAQIVPLAYEHARVGIAMLLRFSYLEPCLNRASWLAAHLPTQLIVLPRISFTGDGKTDNVTCAWFVWIKDCVEESGITIVPRRSFDVGNSS